MIKLLIYCHVFYPETSGYSSAFQNFIGTLAGNIKDIEITVVTPSALPNYSSEFELEKVRVVRLKPKTNLKTLRYFINQHHYAKIVSSIFKREGFDLLMVETFDQPIFLSCLDKNVYKRLVVRIHSTSETEYTMFSNIYDFPLRRWIIKKYLAKKVIWIASTNSFHIDFAKKFFYSENLIDIGDRNFFVLPNPVRVDSPNSFSVGERIKIFTLGRMEYLGNNQKGFADLIYALKLLPKDVSNKFEITIVGKGDMRDTLINMCHSMSNIKFIETMAHEEVIRYLKESDVVVLPSRYEGLSMFALEGLSTGNVCLFSSAGGLVDMVDGNGILFPPQDIEKLAGALTVLANSGKEPLEAMKRKSVELCEEKFSPKIVSEKFKLIAEVVSGA